MTAEKAELLELLKKTLKKNDWVLVKGSRAMAMEDIVKGLKDYFDRNEAS